jgi:hypothetical protein
MPFYIDAGCEENGVTQNAATFDVRARGLAGRVHCNNRQQTDCRSSGSIDLNSGASDFVQWLLGSYAIADVIGRAGANYLASFQGDQGLAGSDKPAFLTALGLGAEQPQDFSPDGWLALLQDHGALWVTTNEGPGQFFAVHARVVVGVFGDGTGDGTSL